MKFNERQGKIGVWWDHIPPKVNNQIQVWEPSYSGNESKMKSKRNIKLKHGFGFQNLLD